MFKNVAAKFILFAFDATTNVPKTGDAANITAYVSKDYGTVTVLGDTSATEMDATNAAGYYLFDSTAGETNADCLLVSGKSSTANIKVIGAPAVIYTRPNTGWLAPATAGRTLVVDASGLADANMVKAGPTGSGTAITARDIGASVLLSSGTGTGQVKLASGYVAPNWGDVGNPTTAVNLTATQIQSVNNLAAGTDSINTTATSNSTLTTGSAVSGTYASTSQLDGTYWQIADTTGTLDMYFEFNVGSTGVPTSAEWVGGLTTAVNTLKVYAYNWGGASWDQVGTIAGTTSLITNTSEFDFTTAHVGTGGNLGLVRLRFQNTGLTGASFYTDRVICGYTNSYSFPTNFSSLSIDGSGRIDVIKVNGTSQTAGDIYSKVSGLTFTGANKVDASVRDWIGGTIPAVNVTGVPLVDLKYTLGTISPATAGSVRADAVTGAVGSVTGAVGSVTGNVGGNVVGSVASVTARVTANTDQLNGVAASAANIAKTTSAIVRCTASGVPTTTSIPTSACTPAGAAADQFKGRLIVFDADTATTALRGQVTDITASTNAATPTFTVTALTTAAASGDTFSIV